MNSSKLAFLGAGNLAAAIVRGLLEKKVYAPTEIACISKSGVTAKKLAAETGIISEPDLVRLLASADIVVVAFKPQSLADADLRLAELTRGKLVVSLLAGKTTATLARSFPHARNLVRTMPNTPAAIGAGVTSYTALAPLNVSDRASLAAMLDALGIHLEAWENRIIETKKGTVRLLPVSERAEQLFGKDGAEAVADRLEAGPKKDGPKQLGLFDFLGDVEEPKPKKGRTKKGASVADEALKAKRETTTLDRVHVAMLLQSGGRTNALRTLLKDELVSGGEFLRLANALSALYPQGSEEKRLLDAMLLAMPR